MGGRVVEGARLESVFRLNRLTWVRIPPHPPLKKSLLGLFLLRKRGEERAHVRVGSVSLRTTALADPEYHEG